MANENFTRFIPGMHYKNNKLYVFKTNSVMVLKSWPEIRAWRRTKIKQWQSVRVNINLNTIIEPEHYTNKKTYFTDYEFPKRLDYQNLLTREIRRIENFFAPPHKDKESEKKLKKYIEFNRQKMTSLIQWYTQIPSDIIAITRQFATRQWHILSMLGHIPQSKDLLLSNPAIGFCLASNWVFHKPSVQKPFRAIRHLLQKKRTHILDWLGFNNQKSVIKIFAKIKPQFMNIYFFFILKTLLQDKQKSKILHYIQDIKPLILYILSRQNLSFLFSYKVLYDLSETSTQDYTIFSSLIKDLEGLLVYFPEERRNIKINSVSKIMTVHNRLIDMINRTTDFQSGSKKIKIKYFQKPPFPATKEIVPILNSLDLFNEGKLQNNCVFSYQPKIFHTNFYIYRVLYPQRATLSIIRKNNQWIIDQLYGYGNSIVTEETEQKVKTWLKENQRSGLQFSDLEDSTSELFF